MISAEEIKALMAKDENGLLPCAICGMPANINWKVRGMAGSPPEMIIECSDSCERFSKPKPRDYYSFGELYINYKKDEWNTRAYTPALSILQTLLNQAAEHTQELSEQLQFAAEKLGYCGEGDGKGHKAGLGDGMFAFNTLKRSRKFLAAIEPYLSKEGE